jgi:hypothetical protein
MSEICIKSGNVGNIMAKKCIIKKTSETSDTQCSLWGQSHKVLKTPAVCIDSVLNWRHGELFVWGQMMFYTMTQRTLALSLSPLHVP